MSFLSDQSKILNLSNVLSSFYSSFLTSLSMPLKSDSESLYSSDTDSNPILLSCALYLFNYLSFYFSLSEDKSPLSLQSFDSYSYDYSDYALYQGRCLNLPRLMSLKHLVIAAGLFCLSNFVKKNTSPSVLSKIILALLNPFSMCSLAFLI